MPGLGPWPALWQPSLQSSPRGKDHGHPGLAAPSRGADGAAHGKGRAFLVLHGLRSIPGLRGGERLAREVLAPLQPGVAGTYRGRYAPTSLASRSHDLPTGSRDRPWRGCPRWTTGWVSAGKARLPTHWVRQGAWGRVAAREHTGKARGVSSQKPKGLILCRCHRSVTWEQGSAEPHSSPDGLIPGVPASALICLHTPCMFCPQELRHTSSRRPSWPCTGRGGIHPPLGPKVAAAAISGLPCLLLVICALLSSRA